MMKHLLLAGGLLFGLLLIVGAIASTLEVRETQKWPVVPGTILDSKLFRSDSGTWLDIEYTYEVDELTYTNIRSITGESWQEVPSTYRPKSEINVYYDPQQHSRSILSHATYESPIVLAIFGGIVWLICAPFVFWFGLLLIIDRLQRKAKYHMREALKEISGAQDELDAMRSRGEEIPEELLQREAELLSAASHAHEMLQEIDQRRRSLGRYSETSRSSRIDTYR